MICVVSFHFGFNCGDAYFLRYKRETSSPEFVSVPKMKLQSLLASCLVAATLVECKKLADVKGLEIKEQKKAKTEKHRQHSDHHRRHRRRGHHHHRRRHDDERCRACPPRDLCLCTEKVGHYTVITRPIPHCQAEAACATIGLRMARIDINNFMDSTMAAFKCSGPFSQTWIKSWNGDDYRNKGIVLSTGSAAPGGSINEVLDGEFGRNVLCEPADCEVKKPECDECHPRRERHRRRRRHHRKPRTCGCRHCHQGKSLLKSGGESRSHHRMILKCQKSGPPRYFAPVKMPQMKNPINKADAIKIVKKQEDKANALPGPKPAQLKAVRWFKMAGQKKKDLPADTVQVLLQTPPTEGKTGEDEDSNDYSDEEDGAEQKKVVAQEALRATPVIQKVESKGKEEGKAKDDGGDDEGTEEDDDADYEDEDDEDDEEDYEDDDEDYEEEDGDEDYEDDDGDDEEMKKPKKEEDGRVVKIEV